MCPVLEVLHTTGSYVAGQAWMGFPVTPNQAATSVTVSPSLITASTA